MKYSLRSLMIVVLVLPPLLVIVSSCAGFVADFIFDPLPYRGADPDYYYWVEFKINAARLTCPLIVALVVIAAMIFLGRVAAKGALHK